MRGSRRKKRTQKEKLFEKSTRREEALRKKIDG